MDDAIMADTQGIDPELVNALIELGREKGNQRIAALGAELERVREERDAARADARGSVNQYARLLGQIRSYADDFTICPFCSVRGDNAHLRTCLVSEAEGVLKGLKR